MIGDDTAAIHKLEFRLILKTRRNAEEREINASIIDNSKYPKLTLWLKSVLGFFIKKVTILVFQLK